MSVKGFLKFAAGAAAVCAGVYAYRKYKDKKEPETVWDNEPEEKTVEKDAAGNVAVHVEIPGVLTKINVKAGDHVNQGDAVAFIGCDMPVEAPVSGVVEEITAEENSMVSTDDTVMTIKAD